MFSCLVMISCYKTNVVQYETWNQDPTTKVSGLQINAVQRQYNVVSGKKFLSKYDETMWADTENYFSSFSDIKFDIDIRFLMLLNISYPPLILVKMFNIIKDGKKVKTLMMEKNGI